MNEFDMEKRIKAEMLVVATCVMKFDELPEDQKESYRIMYRSIIEQNKDPVHPKDFSDDRDIQVVAI